MAKPADVLFKDFYQVLQLQPHADSGMVDQAYWYLARAYNETQGPHARAQLDDLNEAYSVLRSPALREAYDKIRDGLLGQGAPPTMPRSDAPRPPLHMMSRRQSPRPASLVSAVQTQKRRGLSLQKLRRLVPRLPRRRPAKQAPDKPADPTAGRDLDTLYKSTEAARARWRASAEPGAPYNGIDVSTPPEDRREAS